MAEKSARMNLVRKARHAQKGVGQYNDKTAQARRRGPKVS